MNDYGIEVDYMHAATAGEVVRVDRPHLLGNPYSHMQASTAPAKVATREEAVAAHEWWLWHSGQAGAQWEELWQLAQRVHTDGSPKLLSLRCACTEPPCHAVTLVHALSCCRQSLNMPRVIANFRGPHRVLSNFHGAEVHYDGETYPSVEHAFQAAKTLNLEARANIRKMQHAWQAKSLGRLVVMRPDWDELKVEVMRDLLARKFMWPVHAEPLDATGDLLLIEGNTWRDRVWGVYMGEGQNMLGKLLMDIRQCHRPRKPLALR